MAQDQEITCSDCGTKFTWTAEEQEFYQKNQFSAPKRCKSCRAKRKADWDARQGN
jgi:DNA-directed RNA polymerase subunit RPC12/RpoP